MPGLVSAQGKISPNLDLLRAVAVMSVFLSHFFTVQNDFRFGSLGRFGVTLFFIHTSFVLMASLHRLAKTAKNDARLAFAFWIRRIFRIYPLSILFVVLLVIIHPSRSPWELYSIIGLKGFLSNLALVQNITGSKNILGVLWSLPLEVEMYVILPFAYFFIRGVGRYSSLSLWMASILLALTVVLLMAFTSSSDFQRAYFFLYAPCFTSGIVAFDLSQSRTNARKLPAWVWPVGMFVAIALSGPHGDLSDQARIFRIWGLALFLGILYPNVKESRTNWAQIVLHWIAEHSYGIYLSHGIILWFVLEKMALHPLWLKVPILILGSTGVPALLYVLVEKPMIKMGGKFAEQILSVSQKCQPGAEITFPLNPKGWTLTLVKHSSKSR